MSSVCLPIGVARVQRRCGKSMRWGDVDAARDHLTDEQRLRVCSADHNTPRACSTCGRPSKKTVYEMVNAGMKVAPRGHTGKRFWFSLEWIDDFLEERASNPSALRQVKKTG
jgi:hypothetical protein